MTHPVKGQRLISAAGQELTGLGINRSTVEIVNDVGDALYRAIPINHNV